jgi:hypothetical protein
MKFIKKMHFAIVMAYEFIRYKLSLPTVPFWVWARFRLKNGELFQFHRTCLAVYIFFDAIDREDKIGICEIYQLYRKELSRKKRLPETGLIAVRDAAISEKRDNVLKLVMAEIKRDA